MPTWRHRSRFACAVLVGLLFIFPAPAADKPSVTVLDFQVDQVSEAEMKTLISLLSSALLETREFTVIDVTQRDALLKEIEFAAADCTDESCQVEIGRLLAAEYVVTGRIGRIGKKHVVSLKLLETSTSRTVRAADGVYDELEAALDDLSGLAAKLSGSAPEPAARAPAAGTAVPAERTEAAKPALASRERKPVSPRMVAAAACAAGAIGSGAAGGVLLYLSGKEYAEQLVPAYQDYLAAAEGSAAFGVLYQAYEDSFAAYKRRFFPGARARRRRDPACGRLGVDARAAHARRDGLPGRLP